jgi:phage head maturation protease
LDSHQTNTVASALGRIVNAWVGGERLMGRLAFNDTDAGRNAEGMVARREISGVSAGYSVQTWQISDADGYILDPDLVNWGDDDLTFTATAWTLMECSLVSVPADSLATIRNDRVDHLSDVRARMEARQNMSDRMSFACRQSSR